MRVSAAVALALLSFPAVAYDSRCRDTEPDCDGLEAARRSWVVVEHSQLWIEARFEAGLPNRLDGPFDVTTFTAGGEVAGFPSLQAAPLDLATDKVRRTISIPMFAQLPDLAYTLWDWTSGNEGCPPSGSDGFVDCHKFKAHMGWLNSNHFLPQAETYFRYLHGLALARAGECAAMAQQLRLAGETQAEILEACDREALIIEAQAHHYLQDAWSMGHMWQRWGSPELSDFSGALGSDPSLFSVKALGDAVGRASGIIHGAKAITTFADAMCAPDEGIEFSYDDELVAGAGDLFIDKLRDDDRLALQKALLGACATTAVREVYLASAQSFGPATDSLYAPIDLARCFPQRASNRAIGLGAAVQLPSAVLAVPFAQLLEPVSSHYLASLDLTSSSSSFYVPLTSEILTRVNPLVDLIDDELIASEIVVRWHEDMRGLQGILRFVVRDSPDGTELADGGLGPLLRMEPGAGYEGIPSYADPPLPWTPTVTDLPLEATLDNAPNILARTFVDAHAADWCEAMSVDGEDEFSLNALRDRCVNAASDVACDVCELFAARHLTSNVLGDTPLCEVLVAESAAIDASDLSATSRAELAATWCSTPPVDSCSPPGGFDCPVDSPETTERCEGSACDDAWTCACTQTRCFPCCGVINDVFLCFCGSCS